MTRTARLLVVAAAALLTLVPAGIASAAERSSGDAPAHGTVVALDGTTSDGEAFSSSQPVHDPVYGTCYDLLAPDGRAADWTEVVDGTNRTIALSSRNCMEAMSGQATTRTLAAGQRSTGWTFRAFIVAPTN